MVTRILAFPKITIVPYYGKQKAAAVEVVIPKRSFAIVVVLPCGKLCIAVAVAGSCKTYPILQSFSRETW